MADRELSLPPKSSASSTTKDSSLKLLNQVEYYFSDLNLATTDNLMKFISKDPDGFVPVSVVASLKKVKPLFNDHRQVVTVMRNSSKLVVSDDGKKVKRLYPINESDMEELQSRIVVAENLPKDQCRQNLMKIFSAVGSVKAIQTSASRSEKSGNICYINKLHAYVEYASAELAEKAVAELNGENNGRNGLRVHLMAKRMVMNRNKRSKKKKTKSKTTVSNDDVTPLTRSKREEREDSVPVLEHNGTPPIQPSVSPEILTTQSQFPRQMSLSSSLSSTMTTPGCFTYAAGHHVLSGVTDKRKCRPRGLLAVANSASVEDDAFLAYPSPAHASVRWLGLSPSDASSESFSATPPLISSAATSSGCSSGNVIRTPASDSTPHNNFASQLDSVDASFRFETLTLSHASADLTHFRQLVEVSDPLVSSRDVSLSEIYEMDDELDCCRCLSDDDVSNADVVGVDIFEDKDINGCCAESISVDEGGLLASSTDSDWDFVRQKL